MMMAMYGARVALPGRGRRLAVRRAGAAARAARAAQRPGLVMAVCRLFDDPSHDYAFGRTRLFFRAGRAVGLNTFCRDAPSREAAVLRGCILQWKLGPCRRSRRRAEAAPVGAPRAKANGAHAAEAGRSMWPPRRRRGGWQGRGVGVGAGAGGGGYGAEGDDDEEGAAPTPRTPRRRPRRQRRRPRGMRGPRVSLPVRAACVRGRVRAVPRGGACRRSIAAARGGDASSTLKALRMQAAARGMLGRRKHAAAVRRAERAPRRCRAPSAAAPRSAVQAGGARRTHVQRVHRGHLGRRRSPTSTRRTWSGRRRTRPHPGGVARRAAAAAASRQDQRVDRRAIVVPHAAHPAAPPAAPPAILFLRRGGPSPNTARAA